MSMTFASVLDDEMAILYVVKNNKWQNLLKRFKGRKKVTRNDKFNVVCDCENTLIE